MKSTKKNVIKIISNSERFELEKRLKIKCLERKKEEFKMSFPVPNLKFFLNDYLWNKNTLFSLYFAFAAYQIFYQIDAHKF